MNNRLHNTKIRNSAEKQEIDPKKQRLHFILLRILLFVVCIVVSVGIWLAVHYVEYLRASETETSPSASFQVDENLEYLC